MLRLRFPGRREMPGRRIKELRAWLHHPVAFDPTHD
jgi:hypothetical protein